MNITVVGTGYVGLVVGACFAEAGHTVICADVDESKIEGLSKNRLPIYEPGLRAFVERNQRDGRLSFATDVGDAIGRAAMVFIAVDAPIDADGVADLSRVLAVSDLIGRHMRGETVIGTKSTVPMGTWVQVRKAISQHAKHPFHLCSNPEFLREGAAIADFMKPDRVIVGTDSEFARAAMTDLYAPLVGTGKPIIFMDPASAELTKYAANGMLATRITFMNELARLCERTGADIEMVRRGIASDERIGAAFLHAGPGYGGSCLPKDVRAIVHTGRAHQAPLRILEAVAAANDTQKRRVFELLQAAFGTDLRGKRIAVWGLAFKPNTDDMRESPALALVESLVTAGAEVIAHDPVAMDEGRRRLGDRIAFSESHYGAVEGADALAIMTEWDLYRQPDFDRVMQSMRQPVVVDGRNLHDPTTMAGLGFRYLSIGRQEPRVTVETTLRSTGRRAE